MALNFRHLARVTIEFTTPFKIGAGRGDESKDELVVTDANGLATIPGSSLAGVIRSAFKSIAGERSCNDVFGFQEKRDGRGSRITFSWANVHDKNNKIVEGIIDSSLISSDPILSSAKSKTTRDRVRINHQGVVDDHGKFDEEVVCAGHRFTFEMELVSDRNDPVWKQLLDLLHDPMVRFGGGTRHGFGAFKVINIKERVFDLQNAKDFADYSQLSVSLKVDPQVLQQKSIGLKASSASVANISIQPEGYWMWGGGVDVEKENRQEYKDDADMAPVRDDRIVWNGDVGQVQENVVLIPAASVKGAIAHRVAFHYNALKGRFADHMTPEEIKAHSTAEKNEAVRELFGSIKDSDGKLEGQRGRVLIDDMYVANPPESRLLHHVAIDRFTGGAREGMLFSERPFWQGSPFAEGLSVTLLGKEAVEKIDKDILVALEKSFDDLAQGRLQMGAGSGRGHGYFKGTWKWEAQS